MLKHFAEAFEVLVVGQKYARNDSNFKVVVEVPFDLQKTQRSHSSEAGLFQVQLSRRLTIAAATTAATIVDGGASA